MLFLFLFSLGGLLYEISPYYHVSSVGGADYQPITVQSLIPKGPVHDKPRGEMDLKKKI